MPRPTLPPPAHDMGANEKEIVKRWWTGSSMVMLETDSVAWLAAHTWTCAEPKECPSCAKWRVQKKSWKREVPMTRQPYSRSPRPLIPKFLQLPKIDVYDAVDAMDAILDDLPQAFYEHWLAA